MPHSPHFDVHPGDLVVNGFGGIGVARVDQNQPGYIRYRRLEQACLPPNSSDDLGVDHTMKRAWPWSMFVED
jgi:hypothetical protein